MRVPRSALAPVVLAAALVAAAVPAGATSATRLVVTSRTAAVVTTAMPLVRLHLSARVVASRLPALRVRPALATKWRQTGARDVEAVVTGRISPNTRYVIAVPIALTCARACAVTSSRPHTATAVADPLLDEELLAGLGYLPLTFTPTYPAAPGQSVPGTFAWSYPSLPTTLTSLWRAGAPNVLLTGALMAFQEPAPPRDDRRRGRGDARRARGRGRERHARPRALRLRRRHHGARPRRSPST